MQKRHDGVKEDGLSHKIVRVVDMHIEEDAGASYDR